MNEGIHLDLDTWIVPGQIHKASLCRGLGNRYTPAGTEVLISAVAHNTPIIIIWGGLMVVGLPPQYCEPPVDLLQKDKLGHLRAGGRGRGRAQGLGLGFRVSMGARTGAACGAGVLAG